MCTSELIWHWDDDDEWAGTFSESGGGQVPASCHLIHAEGHWCVSDALRMLAKQLLYGSIQNHILPYNTEDQNSMWKESSTSKLTVFRK